ncbi:MAG TPA: glycogen debranching protein GlgX [Steroidobacteraceae bacterium]|nr:glycogen debranching protein GlgX [Steroidobacteraceae bacterium]
MKLMQAGSPRPLGATWTAHGANFAVFSAHATRVEVALFDPATGEERARHDLPGHTGDVWHGLLAPRQASPGARYAFHVHGPDAPEQGLRFDPTVPLIDPYARCLSGSPRPRATLVDGEFDWGEDRPPSTPWPETVIYELHVKGMTQLHPAVPPAWRGKYLGLTVPEVIEHMRSIGVTAVELLPVQAFISEGFLRDRGLVNYWGYNPIAWFAPASEYAIGDAVPEFKAMVKALHAAGIEVILDVVFNHTAEGNDAGPMLSLKGIDNPVYYRLSSDRRYYDNVSGCGNTVDCGQTQVRTLIIDCLKYWVEVMHVDGFRFDLATVLGREEGSFNEHAALFKALRGEPALAYVKMIAEPWDIGPGGYQLGRFPAGWSEWNDRYRDGVRSFWRRDRGRLGELAERFAGSSDLFRHNGRKPTAGVNFVTAHDGFTLNDLVSYNDRHNEANGEANRDGHHGNLSWNCGVEGPTDDPAVSGLRVRQMKNLLATLFLSQGVPMLLAGDELARTQRGNNNTYCQDNELSWIDWQLRSVNRGLLRFVQRLAQVRRRSPEFRRETFLKGASSRAGVKDVIWLNVRGAEMTQGEWQDESLRALGAWFGKRNDPEGRLLLLMNADDTEQVFSLPPPPAGQPWSRQFDTSRDHEDAASLGDLREYALIPSSMALLEC